MARFPRKCARICMAVALTIGMVAGLAPGAVPAEPVRRDRVVLFQDEEGAFKDYDRRLGRVAPSRAQVEIVARLDGSATWNRFGTPISLISHAGFLDEGLSGKPAAAARRWIADHRTLFRLRPADVAALRLQHVLPLGDGWAVQFRQTYEGFDSVVDGRITLALDGDRLAYVSSSAAPGSSFETTPQISALDAVLAASEDVGFGLSGRHLAAARRDGDWDVFASDVISEPARARLRALPTPKDGVRLGYETLLIDNDHANGHPEAWVHFIDAVTGRSLRRESRIQFERAPEPPTWSVYPNSPPLDYDKPGKRVLWCWNDAKGCERGVKNKGAYGPWDTIPGAGAPTFTTSGNAAKAAQSWISPLTPGEQYAPASPTREYVFPFTNQWYETGCSPAAFATPERIDVDAATANLFAMHNRLHDWSYLLGFTEEAYNMQVVNEQGDQSDAEGNDPEVGNSQAGAMFGTGTPLYGRDNANQITPQDGVPPITNMYLWQPIGATFYPPCVDGDFDMAVIGHEYTHAISNRMVAGPDSGLSGAQAGAMGESWSDLMAVEYLNEYGFAPVGKENPFAVGAYVTGDLQTAIRNYGMNHSPLNYSNVAYDFVGAQVHADGEIWSATNFSIREALIRHHNERFPASDRQLQRACADGKVDADRCPGNRQWVQIVFDAWKLMESGVSMLDARDAYMAADKVRFDSANQDVMWRVFAQRGMGKGAKSNGTGDEQPTPSFEDPRGSNGKVKFEMVDDSGKKIDGQIFVGDYEARSTPIVSSGDSKETMASGTYDFVAQALGYGMKRFRADVGSGDQTVVVKMPINLASSENGAKARGDGAGWGALIDDSEVTNWTSDEGPTVEGKQVTVDLAGGKHVVDYVNVSAMLNNSGGQNRFSALRQFAIEVCSGACKKADDFKRVFTSDKDAFPGKPPRPKAPPLLLKSFDIPDVAATHVRLVVLTNQCTGVKEFKKENDQDTTKRSTCLVGYEPVVPGQPDIVRAAELQVFGR
ncbi:MAG TPA: M36 family metallopeptidase [Actinomycetota bacterium]|nr:M36 family metallopeptidase [Actinomycetota bacterium]